MRTLRWGFSRSVERFADREALVVGQHRVTYRELDARARQVAATLERHALPGEGALTAVFGHRHPTTFAGILGALSRGHGYVPLNPTFPVERTRAMLARAGCRALVVDPTAYGQLGELLSGLDEPLVVLAPDAASASALSARFAPHTLLCAGDLAPADACVAGEARADDVAYLLFTSGSTGVPKGVAVTHENVLAFLDVMTERYGIDEHDRLSHTFDLTFDLSVFDLFCAWERGACVFVPTAQEKLFPARYVRRNELTVWFGVPSTAVMMSRLGMLEPDAYPALRWVLFCGEALPVEVAARFARAAPRAVVENLYGPTELTIACTLHRFDARASEEHERGLVPIGAPYPGMHAIVVDEELREVPRGEAGELLMTGPQRTRGYWRDPERTARAFVQPPGHEHVFYRTGDRVRWPQGGPLVYLGRVDHQIKIQGYRVELGEVEAVLREISGAAVAVAVGWPRTASGADGIVGFVAADDGVDPDAVLAAVRSRLPAYMQPSRIHVMPRLPLGPNGKVDRGALVRVLEELR